MFGRGVAVNPELLAFPQGTQMSLNFSKSLSGSGVTRFSVSQRPCMYLLKLRPGRLLSTGGWRVSGWNNVGGTEEPSVRPSLFQTRACSIMERGIQTLLREPLPKKFECF